MWWIPYQIFFFLLLKTLPDFPPCFGVTLPPFDQTGLIAPISSSSSSDGRICHSQDWADGGAENGGTMPRMEWLGGQKMPRAVVELVVVLKFLKPVVRAMRMFKMTNKMPSTPFKVIRRLEGTCQPLGFLFLSVLPAAASFLIVCLRPLKWTAKGRRG